MLAPTGPYGSWQAARTGCLPTLTVIRPMPVIIDGLKPIWILSARRSINPHSRTKYGVMVIHADASRRSNLHLS